MKATLIQVQFMLKCGFILIRRVIESCIFFCASGSYETNLKQTRSITKVIRS